MSIDILQIFYANLPPAVTHEAQEIQIFVFQQGTVNCVYSQKKCLRILNLNFLKVFFFLYNIFIGS